MKKKSKLIYIFKNPKKIITFVNKILKNFKIITHTKKKSRKHCYSLSFAISGGKSRLSRIRTLVSHDC